MKVIIRTDIGSHHGMGHAVRMLALARELRKQVPVVFVDATPLLRSYVTPFPCYGPDETASAAAGDVLVIDTKAADWANDDSALYLARDAGMRIVRIDHPHATPGSCDLLIGPCAHWDFTTVTRLQDGFGDRFLYGWDYVMLDPQVTALAPLPFIQRKDGPIVFAAGGTDPSGALQQWYDWTASVFTEAGMVFLVGTQSPMLNPRDRSLRASRSLVTSFDRTWIRTAGHLVTMFGVTCYEALWWQIPQSIFSHTPENAVAGDHLEGVTEGCCLYEGALADQTAATCRSMLLRSTPYRTSPWNAEPLSWRLDGHGVVRIATAIIDVHDQQY